MTQILLGTSLLPRAQTLLIPSAPPFQNPRLAGNGVGFKEQKWLDQRESVYSVVKKIVFSQS